MQLVLFKKKLNIKHYINLLINTINIFVLSCVMMIRPIPVLADDDNEYLMINDIEIWNAYQYFREYGLNADIVTNYTATLNSITNSTYTGTFNFSGSFSGTIGATVNLSYVGEIGDSDLGVASIISTENIHIGSSANPSHTIEMSITPDGNGTLQNNGFSFACTYNAQSTATNSVMNCTPSSGSAENILYADQTITVDQLEVYAGSQGTYLVKMLNEGTETGSISGNLSASGSGNGNISISENGVISTSRINTNKLEFVLPLLRGNISNIKTTYTAFRLDKNKKFVIAILTKSEQNTIQNLINNIKYYSTSMSDPNTAQLIRVYKYELRGGFILSYVELNTGYDITGPKDSTFYIIFNNPAWVNNSGLIPLYFGFKDNMSDNLYRYIYGSDRLIELLENGNIDSQNAGYDISVAGGDFDEYGNDLINIESDVGFDMGQAVENVQLNNSIISNNGFLNAANWVRTQYENITSYSPINSVLVFCLSLGFALLIIGKIR